MHPQCTIQAFVHEYHELKVTGFKGKIISIYVSVKEGSYGMGINVLIEEGYIKDVDFSIITEPSAGFTGNKFPDICLGARGRYGLDIELFGKSAHAATPKIGISAVEDVAKVVYELKNVEYVEGSHLGTGDACVIAVESDGGACSVPDYAKINLFWHIVVGENPETITNEIEKAIERTDIKCEYKINFRKASSEGSKGFIPYTISGKEFLAKEFTETVEDVCKTKPSISYFQSIGDFNYLGSRLDAPAIIFGASGKNFHGSDEYVELDSVYMTAKVVYKFLENMLKDELQEIVLVDK